MNTLLFLSLSVLSCENVGSFVGKHGVYRCEFNREMIVNATEVKTMEDFRYFLGPVSKTVNLGCRMGLRNNTTVVHGKPCRKFFGEK